MLRVCLVAALLVPMVASASPRRAITRDDIRVDREIGDSNGWVDDLELAVARASYDGYLRNGGKLPAEVKQRLATRLAAMRAHARTPKRQVR